MSHPDIDTRDDVRGVIVDAAERLLREQGLRAVTTRAVAHAANVQAPTIYRLFGDKDGLIEAVAEQVMTTYVASKSDSVRAVDLDPVADLRSGWQLHQAFGLANAELYSLLNTPGRRSPATAAGIEVLRARVRRVAAAGRLRVDEQRALMMIHAAGTGTVLATLGTPAADRDPGLSDTMFDAVLAAILTDGPPAADTSLASMAIAFVTMINDLPALTDAERALMTEWLTRSIGRLQ